MWRTCLLGLLGLAVLHWCALLGRQSPLPDRSATPEAKFKTSALRRFAASSKLVRVRVDAS